MAPTGENGCVQEDEGLGWGKSLPVPSVQEIVRNDPQCVPERYIQQKKDRPLDSELYIPAASSEIPIISFSLLANGDEDELKKLDSACKDWGFFQLVNHGIAEKVLQDMKAAVAAFFELPRDEKLKYAMAANDLQGYGQGFVVSELQKLDWCDLIMLITHPPNLRKMKLWPTTVPGFKDAVEKYSEGAQKVAEELLADLSLLMGMDRDGLKKLHGEMKQAMRMNYYPTCSRPDLVLGISPHSDGGTITLLLQGDDEITALQIKNKDRWVPIKPIPNALVVNVGDAAEVFSNGVYRSIEHRALANTSRPRMSVATAMLPNDEAEIGPVESMVNDDRPRVYRNVKYVDFLRHVLENKMEGKAHTDFLKIKS
ncbi:hypothetical protein WN944_017974 [Citrus x changshan-huyou]|uniref:Fe2OG dioxygenase domain-containing protein n=1 Tax=Citrus x changshan-huyou TaxID=2935761 RepID=A0AAP0LTE0_9ROSI